MPVPKTVQSGTILVAGIPVITISGINYAAESVTPSYRIANGEIKTGGVVTAWINTIEIVMLDIEVNYQGDMPTVGMEFTHDLLAPLGVVTFVVAEPCILKTSSEGGTKQTFTLKAMSKVGTVAVTY